MTPYIIIGAIAVLIAAALLFARHQRRLADRARLMRESFLNRDFSFRLPTRGLFFGERVMQQTLNQIGDDIRQLVDRNEVESWQRLTRVLTHEIMNATTPIQSISQAYLNHPDIKGTPCEEGIRAIHDTSRSLAAFVDSYRKLTQLQQPDPAPVSIAQLADTVRPLHPTLHWQADIPDNAVINADENLLRQVLLNLLKNADEAGARHIDLRWRNAQLLVSNDGPPIPVTARREIFVPFFTTKKTGSGIGLSLSRQIMMAQGMNITLADTPVEGFHVTFIVG